jgi:hypothetical protein
MSTSGPRNSGATNPSGETGSAGGTGSAPPVSDAKVAADMSESDYLARQAEVAKLAISRALSDAKAALAEGLDPKEWTRRYPFVAVGSAIAAGFAAAVLTIPSKEQQELHKLEKIRRAMHPEPESAKEAKAEQKPLWSTLLHEAVQLIRPVLVSAVSAGIGRASAPHEGDGHDPASVDAE